MDREAFAAIDYARDVAAIHRIAVVPQILEVICRTTGLGFAAVARVTEQRWVACAVRDDIGFGLTPGGELQIETTICNEIRQNRTMVVSEHGAEEAVFCSHTTPKQYGFQSYISEPITLPNGRFFGTLCAIDPRPANVSRTETVAMFRLFAELIALHLEAQERLERSEAALSTSSERAELQEQFIAVLGHDLRNPLSAIQTGARTLLATSEEPRVVHVAAVIDRSASRMSELVHHVLDFAHSRLGSGLPVSRHIEPDLQNVLAHVINEARTAHPDREIQAAIDLHEPVRCDRNRMQQLVSNLVANALTHGDPAGPVRLDARSGKGVFELAVSNRGEPIAETTRPRLFQPFARAAQGSGGLGLGLYIASQIARAHDGSLDVSSTEDETRFTFRMATSPP